MLIGEMFTIGFKGLEESVLKSGRRDRATHVSMTDRFQSGGSSRSSMIVCILKEAGQYMAIAIRLHGDNPT